MSGVVLVCEKLLYIAEALGLSTNQLFAHTDSLVSLHWINKNKNNLKTYVSNRVAKIQQSKIQVLFTPGKQNPADLCSKPKPSKEYINNPFWTTGPSYIQQSDNDWMEKYKIENILQLDQNTIPKEKLAEFENEIKESISITVNTADITVKELESEGIYGTINIYSNYHTMLNVVAQCFRAIHLMTKGISNNVRREQLRSGFELARIPSAVSKNMSEEEQRKMHITASQKELNFAKEFLIKETQKLAFPEEYQALEKGEAIPAKSSLLKLNPGMRDGLIVMKGRLENLYTMPEQVKHPIILPKDARITQLIILHHHK